MKIKIKGVAIVKETGSDGFRGIDDRSAADRQDKINFFAFGQLDASAYHRMRRIYANAAKFDIVDGIFLQRRNDGLVKT